MENSPNARCHLMELPAELRLGIYEYALAPTGTICLTRSRDKRYATTPVVAPTLLATCRQINEEASSILYEQNSVCIAVDAHDTCWPTVSESRLPQHVLERLQHVCVILDCCGSFRATYEDVDWNPFSALISLKTFRITVLAPQSAQQFGPYPLSSETHAPLIQQLLERIPATTEVLYGTVTGSAEQEFARWFAERQHRSKIAKTFRESDAEQMVDVAAAVEDLQQGCLSGTVEDVFSENHETCSGASVRRTCSRV